MTYRRVSVEFRLRAVPLSFRKRARERKSSLTSAHSGFALDFRSRARYRKERGTARSLTDIECITCDHIWTVLQFVE